MARRVALGDRLHLGVLRARGRLVETFSADPSTSTAVAPVWDAWLYAIIPPLGGLAAASFLTSWAQRYRDGVTERANFPSFAALNERYAGITSVGQATREVTSDVTRRTRAAVRRARRKPDPTAVFAPRYDPSRDLSGVQFSAPHIELPKIELPKIETPKVDLGKVEIGGGNSGDDGGAGLAILLLVALVIAALLGVITAWIVIARVAGTAEPMPEAAASA